MLTSSILHRNLLDEIFTLSNGSWKKIDKIEIEDKALITKADGEKNNLKNQSQFIGFNGEKSSQLQYC